MSFRQWLSRLIAGEPTPLLEPPVSAANPLEEEAAGLNFRSAIDAHVGWKSRLQAVIDGHSAEALSADIVASDHHCVLGKWLYAQGQQQFGHQPDFQALVKNHAHFHTCAGQALTLAQQGKMAEAQALISHGDFLIASQTVVMDLAKLYQQAIKKP